jgi:hypothetical protein
MKQRDATGMRETTGNLSSRADQGKRDEYGSTQENEASINVY